MIANAVMRVPAEANCLARFRKAQAQAKVKIIFIRV
jgi:hypothetical protein